MHGGNDFIGNTQAAAIEAAYPDIECTEKRSAFAQGNLEPLDQINRVTSPQTLK
jgi:hypothetical protein